MIRIGVVCEGPTDFLAIQAFFQHALEVEGVNSELLPIQPEMDNTSPEGGWGNVLLWLNRNPPASRIAKFFGGGLFGGDLGYEPLDCLLVQLDTDVLENASFQGFVRREYGHILAPAQTPGARADQITDILRLAWREDEMNDVDVNRHVPAPAVEATEAWCLAAFTAQSQDFEVISGQTLIDGFMSALETTEGRQPSPPYAEADKNIKRRKRFCVAHRSRSARVADGCEHFGQTLQSLRAFA
ncbi:hypothetical protein FLO80_21115 [Aquicoccus porphyridii]|uniref:DUF4276 family protein n=1 Tax=Aquicoccus porphyridii TaxID=1852029 RepID=A0A5A9YX37_9RHOB|nr:hypothetical protein [Aquicoccus porphyridii]KAA0909533.1 hypothetical protein FLO80_21115 [Aquicoccus porphyridii]